MTSSDPVEAHAQGASRALWNAAARFAPGACVPATLPGLSPKENLERIVRATEKQKRITQEQIKLLVEAVKKGNLILRFPRDK
jgi:hypothetical protein